MIPLNQVFHTVSFKETGILQIIYSFTDSLIIVKCCTLCVQMLQHLQEYSQKMISRTHDIQTQVTALLNEAKVLEFPLALLIIIK